MAAKILIIDDKANLPRFIAMELQAAGYQTSIVSDAAIEPAVVRKLRPDLVILNWDLRRSSSSDICCQLRLDNDRLPIVAITADDTRSCYLAVERGAQTCLTKPFLMTELLAVIDRTLSDSTLKSPITVKQTVKQTAKQTNS